MIKTVKNEIEWTKEQKEAIELSGGTILVSAAAGSGKTAVLVNRIVRKINDNTNNCDVDKLLVVTFSNEAAKEMKERISKSLRDILKYQPDNLHIKKQQMLLNDSDISTIHSFCLKLIKENFFKLRVYNQDNYKPNEINNTTTLSPDFSVVSDVEKGLMINTALEETINEFYDDSTDENIIRSQQFIKLSELISGGDFKGDKRLNETILKVYYFIMSSPFPENWLDNIENLFNLKKNNKKAFFENTQWFEKLVLFLKDELNFCIDALKYIKCQSQKSDILTKKYLPVIEDDLFQIQKAKMIVKNISENDPLENRMKYSEIFDAFRNISLKKSPIIKNLDFEFVQLFEDLKELRTDVRKTIQDLNEILICDENEFYEDLAKQKETVMILFAAVRDFMIRYNIKKAEKNVIDYNDIEHFAINLLVVPNKKHDKLKITPLAKEISKRYEEILIDEYQDTNEAQDLIFKAISKDENNLFMVGDSKQGIYRFRQASPEIFIEKKDRFKAEKKENSNFNDSENSFPKLIILDKNFRSRKEITECCNLIFGTIMSKAVGEIDYDETESLKAGASYNKTENNKITLGIIDSTNEKNGLFLEAEYTAEKIKKLIDDKFEVEEKGVKRPCQPKDFCVLLRSVKGKSNIFLKSLVKRGISAITDTGEGFFETKEINILTSILQSVNNPLCDIPLIATLLSPIYGFSAEDIALIKIIFDKLSNKSQNKKNNYAFYIKVLSLSELTDIELNDNLFDEDFKISANKIYSLKIRISEFLKDMKKYRYLAGTLTSDRLIEQIVEETNLLNIVSVMKNGEIRSANLHLFISMADRYEQSGYKGLSGFMRLVNDLIEKGVKTNDKLNIESDNFNSVKILSIHKSKGLEFPICFVCDLNRNFYKKELYDNLILHNKLGVAPKISDFDLGCRFTTLNHNILKFEKEKELLSEEIRILYVALTRAKERLYLVANEKQAAKKLAKIENQSRIMTAFGNNSHFMMKQSSDFMWIMLSLFKHPDLNILLKGSTIGNHINMFGFNINIDFLMKENIENQNIILKDEKTETENDENIENIDNTNLIFETIKKQNEFIYPYIKSINIPSKISVSELSKNMEQYRLDSLNSEPQFIKNKKSKNQNNKEAMINASGSEKGTAIHALAQFADFEKAKVDLDTEIKRLVDEKYITEYQGKIINRNGFKIFLNTVLASEISKADEVYKEMRIMYNVSVEKIEKFIKNKESEIAKLFNNFVGDYQDKEINQTKKTDKNEEKIVVQGVIDLLFKPKGEEKFVILDYKSDIIKNENELTEKYKEQLILYKNAIEEIIGENVEKCILYSFCLNKEIIVTV